MVFPVTAQARTIEAYLGGAWVPVPMRQGQDVVIQHGAPNLASRAESSTCRGQLDNLSGDWHAQNPLGDYYGFLGQGAPFRILDTEESDSFTRAVTDGWGTATSGYTYALAGSGGSVLTSDWQVTGSAGTQSVPVDNASRASYSSGVTLANFDVRATASVLTGASITGAPVRLYLGLRVVTSQYLVRVTIGTSQAVTIEILRPGAAGTLASVTVAGLVHTYGLTIRGQIEGRTVRGKVWDATGSEPLDWQVIASDAVTTDHTEGGFGLGTIVDSGNTNTKPIVSTWDDVEVSLPLFFGELTRLEPRWVDTDAYVSMSAAGALSGLRQGEPLASALRRGYQVGAGAAGLLAYWPCEDEDGATQLASGVDGGTPMLLSGLPSVAAYSGFDCSSPIPTMATGSRWDGFIPDYTDTGEIQLRFLMAVPSGGHAGTPWLAHLTTTGSARYWNIRYESSGNLSIKVYDAVGTLIHNGGPITFGTDGKDVRVSLELNQSGSDVHFGIHTLDADTGVVGGLGADITSQTLGRAARVVMGLGQDLSGISFGHITVQDELTSFAELANEVRAWRGETAGRRAERLAGEEGVDFAGLGDLDDTAEMGPQRTRTLATLLDECAEADQAVLADARGGGILLRTQESLYNQGAALSLSYSSNHLSTPFLPVADFVGVVNDATITREGGSSARSVLTAGRLSNQAPPNGVRRRDTADTVNLHTDDQPQQVARWITHVGTTEEDRWPLVAVDLSRTPYIATTRGDAADLRRLDVKQLPIGGVVEITGATPINVYDPIRILARGVALHLNRYTQRLEVTGEPASPYQVLQVEDSTYGYLHTEGSELAVAIDTDDTALSVATTVGPLWKAQSSVSIAFGVAGEKVTVTAIANEVMTFRSVGTAAHADNAAVSPGLPSGATSGDLLLTVAAIRATAAAPSSATQGHTLIASYGNIGLFAKVHTGSESAPSISFTGGAAGDTCSAQMVALPGKYYNVANLIAHAASGSNSSAQNVSYPSLHIDTDDCLVLYIGWKQDDFTSATSPGTEIAEASSTVGNDQSLVWSYQIQTTAASIQPGQFTVTGGAAAVSRGTVVALRCDRQAVTATRSANGVVKSHAAGTPIGLHTRTVWALGG